MNTLFVYRGHRFREEIEPKILEHKDDNITLVLENKLMVRRLSMLNIPTLENINIVTVDELLKGKLDNMKFDYIVGNPPYQDRTRTGVQNKIYTLISKKCIDLLSHKGSISFITPSAITKATKGFTLVTQSNLKSVNFSTNTHFDVGVVVCSWVIDRTYHGLVQVTNVDNTVTEFKPGERLYDNKITEHEMFNTYKKIVSYGRKGLSDRMFKYNATSDILKKKSDIYCFPLYKNTNDIYGYLKRPPANYNTNKLCVSMTKASQNSMFESTLDFFQNIICTPINSKEEAYNIKTFITSEYFNRLDKYWKTVDGYGFSNALKYLPKFNKNKSWTNDEVQNFFETFKTSKDI